MLTVMTKTQLRKMVAQNLSQRQIAKVLNVSQGCVKYRLSKYGLKTKKPKYNRRQAIRCRLCGETDRKKFYRYKDGRLRYRCKACDNNQNIQRFRRYKQQAVAYKGGKCERCGYSACLAAMDFHHRTPSQKDPRWRLMRNWPVNKIKEELDKCSLLCCRCHAEIHSEWAMSDSN